jgi:DNA-binding NtrC family response regulator
MEEDGFALNGILDQGGRRGHMDASWILSFAAGLASATPLLKDHRISIVLSECDLGPSTWRDVLAETSSLVHSPLLIVTSHVADGRLWAEALNLGAYDVLAKPFDPDEVLRSLNLAWLRWAGRRNDQRNRASTTRVAAA